VTCDGIRTVPQLSGSDRNVLSPTVDRRVRRTSRDVDEAERNSRRLVDSVSAGRRSSSCRYVGARPFLTSVRQNLLTDSLRGLQPVKSAEQRADVVEPRRREYQPGGCIQY